MRFLTKNRLKRYPIIFLLSYIVIYSTMILGGSGILDLAGKPIGADFLAFWAASKILISEGASAVYDDKKLYEVEKSLTGFDHPIPIIYPPTGFLPFAPLALLPYIPSLFLWLGTTLILYLFTIWRIAPHPRAILLTLAFPGTFLNFIWGQNGFLSASIFGWGLILLEKRPIRGGIILGLMAYKPNLGILIPFCLLASRNWKALLGTLSSSAAMVLATIILFGLNTWIVFFKNLPNAFHLIQHELPLDYQPTIFHAISLLGGNPDMAKALHFIVMLTILSLTSLIWIKKSSPPYLRASLLVIGSTLVSPYFNLHDLVILALPLAWLGWQIYEKGSPPASEMEILVLAWIFPFLTPILAQKINIQLGPFILMAIFFFVWRKRKESAPIN